MTKPNAIPAPRWQQLVFGKFSWRRLATSTLLIYAVLVVWVFYAEDGLVFVPRPSSYTDGPGLFKLTCADGKRITAAYLANPQARFTILYSHGNAEDVGENLPVAKRLHDLGFAVLLYDYHGYGTSEGKPGERATRLDVDAAYDYLVRVKHVAPKQLIAYGRSVGGGPTLDLASRQPVGALVLESTFTDPASVRVPVRLLPWVMFPSLDRLRRLPLPVLVMHGAQDDTIPYGHGRALYAAAPGPKFALWIPEASHDDFKDVAGKRYDAALVSFREYLSRR